MRAIFKFLEVLLSGFKSTETSDLNVVRRPCWKYLLGTRIASWVTLHNNPGRNWEDSSGREGVNHIDGVTLFYFLAEWRAVELSLAVPRKNCWNLKRRRYLCNSLGISRDSLRSITSAFRSPTNSSRYPSLNLQETPHDARIYVQHSVNTNHM